MPNVKAQISNQIQITPGESCRLRENRAHIGPDEPFVPVDPGLSRSFAGLRGAIVDATRAAQDRSDEVQHETNQSRHVASPTVTRLGAIIRATTSYSNRHELQAPICQAASRLTSEPSTSSLNTGRTSWRFRARIASRQVFPSASMRRVIYALAGG